VNAAAVAALYGIQPLEFLSIRDPLEQMLVMAVVQRAESIQRRRSNQMASAVVMGLGYVLFGGKSG
jgi:hypothetical protein